MKTLIDQDQWSRKAHFSFFSRFEEPFFGVTVPVDCTQAYHQARQNGDSFFLYYLYRALQAANRVENFRYRIAGEQVYLFDEVHASPTIMRPDGTFGFAYMDYETSAACFYRNAVEEIARIEQSSDLLPAVSGENIIHFSAVPWLNFSAISHARCFSFPDSSPKISFGKATTTNGVMTMPVSIHVHHGLADGYHIGLFTAIFQQLMNE